MPGSGIKTARTGIIRLTGSTLTNYSFHSSCSPVVMMMMMNGLRCRVTFALVMMRIWANRHTGRLFSRIGAQHKTNACSNIMLPRSAGTNGDNSHTHADFRWDSRKQRNQIGKKANQNSTQNTLLKAGRIWQLQ